MLNTLPDFEVLTSLSRTPLHGYGLISDIRERTGGEVVIGTSSLYAIIRRLLRDGLIENAGDMPSRQVAGDSKGPPRRYYRITDAGSEAVRAEARRIRRSLEAAEAVLQDRLTEDR